MNQLASAEQRLDVIRLYASTLRADLYIGPYMTDILSIIEDGHV